MSNSKPKKTLLSYYASKPSTPSTSTSHDPIPPSSTEQEQPPLKIPRFNEYREAPSGDVQVDVPRVDVPVDVPRVDVPVDIPRIDDSLIRDPGLRLQIWQHPVNNHDEVRRRYIQMGPYQPFLPEYPGTPDGNQMRRFVGKWFSVHHWLEYSPTKDKAYCFPCFLFETNPPSRPAFTVDGFNSWKRVGGLTSNSKCALVKHMGETNSKHWCAVLASRDLRNSVQHIGRALNLQKSEVIAKNRLCLMTSIKTALWLALQHCPFRGHNESLDSLNRGNFLEFIKHSADLNDNVASVVLEKAPKNANYTSNKIQKEILRILGDNVRRKIRQEVGNSKFCILVDEAQDVSNQEQMAIVLRFVDTKGFVKERFFGIVGVGDTTALTLKNAISNILSQYDLQIGDLRGQGYDGASNMRGAWNGLQALLKNECPYAYYIHCFAHQLQLALCAASKEVHEVWQFFSTMNTIVGIVSASPKRQTELTNAQKVSIAEKVACGEVGGGRGSNQIQTLHRAGATRWSSHFESTRSLIQLFRESSEILDNIWLSGTSTGHKQRQEARGCYIAMQSFNFVFMLHLLHKMLEAAYMLCQALQRKNQDIVNAMSFVSSTKVLLQRLRDDGWETFFGIVQSFCIKHGITVPVMDAPYMVGTGRSCQQRDTITFSHHYRVDVFNAAIDYQLMELNHRFPECTTELLILGTALDPRDSFKSFDINQISNLAEKFYPVDFLEDGYLLRNHLHHYQLGVVESSQFQNLSTLEDLCVKLADTGLREDFCLVDRLIRLLLTLPVSTATTERAFSAMKLVKTRLRNKMDEEFLEDCMILCIERDLALSIDLESVIDEFNSIKDRRTQLK